MSFRAFPLTQIQSRSTHCFCRFVSPFMDRGTEAQRGDDLPEVSHMPSKIVALNPNFGCQWSPFHHIAVHPAAGGGWERPVGLNRTSRSYQVEKVYREMLGQIPRCPPALLSKLVFGGASGWAAERDWEAHRKERRLQWLSLRSCRLMKR